MCVDVRVHTCVPNDLHASLSRADIFFHCSASGTSPWLKSHLIKKTRTYKAVAKMLVAERKNELLEGERPKAGRLGHTGEVNRVSRCGLSNARALQHVLQKRF